MAELHRVLKPDGRLYMLQPVRLEKAATLEDPFVTARWQRRRLFGQRDHVRIYGRDLIRRLESAGFAVTVERYSRRLPRKHVTLYGLQRRADLRLPQVGSSTVDQEDALLWLSERAASRKGGSLQMAKAKARIERPTIPPSYFDPDQLQSLADRYGSDYRNAEPFPHVVIDDFLPEEELDLVLAEFLQAHDEVWHRFDNPREQKLAERRETSFGPFTRHLLAAKFNSSVFVDFLESLTGIKGLIPDPSYEGGGLHQIVRGGFLKVHADFNWHEHLKLDRRLNVLVYLNRDWKEEYGGHLELWNREMSSCERRILPIFNRCVIFNTTDFSYHGHPEPLTCPEGMTRKSLALYYYSNGRPADELSDAHSTLFQSRPGEVMRRDVTELGRTPKAIAKALLPPIVADRITALRQRDKRR